MQSPLQHTFAALKANASKSHGTREPATSSWLTGPPNLHSGSSPWNVCCCCCWGEKKNKTKRSWLLASGPGSLPVSTVCHSQSFLTQTMLAVVVAVPGCNWQRPASSPSPAATVLIMAETSPTLHGHFMPYQDMCCTEQAIDGTQQTLPTTQGSLLLWHADHATRQAFAAWELT